MFFRRKVKAIPEVRDALFGDLPLSQWAGSNDTGEPWKSFREAKQLSNSGHRMERMCISNSGACQRCLAVPM